MFSQSSNLSLVQLVATNALGSICPISQISSPSMASGTDFGSDLASAQAFSSGESLSILIWWLSVATLELSLFSMCVDVIDVEGRTRRSWGLSFWSPHFSVKWNMSHIA